MYTRTHILKIVNKVSKDSFRLFFINYKDTLFKDSLNFSLFIDISVSSFQFLTVWKSEKEWTNSYKKSGENLDIKKQISKILGNQCRSTEKEERRNGKIFLNSSFTCETGEVRIKKALIKNRKTERIGNDFVTFTEMSLFCR